MGRINQPPSGDDEKTVAVGSPRRDWRGGTQAEPSWNAQADSEKTSLENGGRSMDDDGKTAYVSSERAPGVKPEDIPLDDPSIVRPKPSPRLSWPARDQHRLPDKPSSVPDNQPTRPVSQPHIQTGASQDEEQTRLYNHRADIASQRERPAPADALGKAADEGAALPAVPVNASEDPVVGWLVVVEGPGKGRSLEIGVGANSLGRDASQRIRIDFGDPYISRDKHAVLIYDPRSRRFFLQSGDVRNLTYINDDLVLTPSELKGGETIVAGQTHLRFVPFCGPSFNWS
ncbi:MAG TPA: FHA domain-containing protein [Microvirga sp.]|nr:FHA domain-containing protein [Microvirga sp.]